MNWQSQKMESQMKLSLDRNPCKSPACQSEPCQTWSCSLFSVSFVFLPVLLNVLHTILAFFRGSGGRGCSVLAFLSKTFLTYVNIFDLKSTNPGFKSWNPKYFTQSQTWSSSPLFLSEAIFSSLVVTAHFCFLSLAVTAHFSAYCALSLQSLWPFNPAHMVCIMAGMDIFPSLNPKIIQNMFLECGASWMSMNQSMIWPAIVAF